MSLRLIIKDVFPPILIRLISRVLKTKTYFTGNYSYWDQKEFDRVCNGYSDLELFNEGYECFKTALKCPGKYEKDCSLLDKEIISWEFLFSFYRILSETSSNSIRKNQIKIYDFGGGFGSMFFMHKAIIGNNSIRWIVIEQKPIIDLISNFQDKDLINPVEFKTLDQIDCDNQSVADLLILSSVLQYLENPYVMLEELINKKPRFIFIDRMPYTKKPYEYLRIQKNSRIFMKSSYPIWFLNKERIISKLSDFNYSLIVNSQKTDPTELFGGMMLFKLKSLSK